MRSAIDDWRTAALDGKLRAMFEFLETLTMRPDDLVPASVAPLRAAGISDAAIEDAINVCALFNIYDRLADALDWHRPGPDAYAASGRSLLQGGYQL